jgi:hypothetical protein
MRHCMALVGVLVSTAVWATEPAPKAAKEPAGEANEGVIDPQAQTQLKKMSDYLSSLKTFKVDTQTIDEKVATDGQKIQELKESKLAVMRPNGLSIDRRGPRGHAILRYDGKQFAVDLPERHEYGVAPAPGDLDAAVDDARERLHVDAPGGDLVVSNPYGDLTDGVLTARYIGLEPVGNVMAHHLAMTKKDVDYQIWIQDGPQPVPLRYVITSKDMAEKPQFTIELHNWQPNVPLAANSFTFTPPPGAKRIELGAPQKASR